MELFAAEIDVVFALNGDQMDMRMRNFEPQNHDCHPFTRYFTFDFYGYPFGEDHHLRKGAVVEVEQVVDFLFGDYQRVSFCQWIDVEKCVEIVIFGDLVRGYLAGNDA